MSWLVALILSYWHDWCSPFSVPCFQARSNSLSDRKRALVCRDCAVLLWCLGAIIAWASSLHSVPLVQIPVTGVAIFRIVDLAFTLLSLGVLGFIRRPLQVYDISQYRVQHHILSILVNYIELLFWFAALYVSASQLYPTSFLPPTFGDTGWGAFLLSASTITTVGYGNVAPQGGIASVLAASEAVLGVISIAMVIGTLVGLSISRNVGPQPHQAARAHARRNRHYVTVGVVLAVFIVVSGIPWWTVSKADRTPFVAFLQAGMRQKGQGHPIGGIEYFVTEGQDDQHVYLWREFDGHREYVAELAKQ